MQLVLEYCKLFHTIPIKGRRQKLFSGFFRLGGTSPTPLAENHFAKKPLAEMGVPPTFNGKSTKFFRKKIAHLSRPWSIG